MSEAAKVRVVQCPKCDNFLPEVTDFSFYQCGGCGAVLKAETNGVDLDASSLRSIGEKTEGTAEILGNIPDKRTVEMSDNLDNESNSSISSSNQAERGSISRSRDENNRSPLTNNVKVSDIEADLIRGKSSNEHQRMHLTQDLEDFTAYHDNDNGLVRSGHLVNGRNAEKSEAEGPWRPDRMDSEAMRYQMDGPLRHDYVFERRIRNENNINVPEADDFEYLGDHRAEALRKLDELKDQLSRSVNLIDKGKEKVPIDPRMMYQDFHPRENYYPDPNFNRPPYQKHYAESFPRMNVPEMGGYRNYPPRYEYDPSHVRGFGDLSRSHMVRRRSHHEYAPSQAYMSGVLYGDDAVPHYADKMIPYPSKFSLNSHHPLCACYQCLENRHVPLPPTAYRDKYENVPSGKMFNYRENPGSCGQRDYKHRAVSGPPHLRFDNGMLRTQWPSYVNSEADGFVNQHAQSGHLASSKLHIQQHHRPVAGGAPFLTCYSCFKLLVLPKRVETKGNNKVRCGACSTIISFVFSMENNSIPSVHVEVEDNHKHVLSARGGKNLDKARTVFSSDDSDCGLHFKDKEVGDSSMVQGRVNKFTETKNPNSTSTRTTSAVEDDRENSASHKEERKLAEDSQPPENSTSRKEERKLAEDPRPPENTTSHMEEYRLAEDQRPPTGSPLQEHFEYSNKYHRVNNVAEGNRNGRSEHDKVLLPTNKRTVRNKQDSSATEIDLSSNEYYNNTGTTFDSGETSGEGDKLKHGGRSAELLLAGTLKRSVNDSNRMSETLKQEKVNVTVNGHLIPNGLVEKAEKLAGSIQPGNYWYDFRAGFWGVEGGPCLGIIPPFIEEFNYPMPKHCAGGNTEIFVNGRELNLKDLNLLASRGLPTESHRSYIIEISGRVLDEDSGEELESLGKLAPTVERMKRGFGMKVPKTAS